MGMQHESSVSERDAQLWHPAHFTADCARQETISTRIHYFPAFFKSAKTITQKPFGSSYLCLPDGEHVTDVSTCRLVDKTTQPEMWHWKEILQFIGYNLTQRGKISWICKEVNCLICWRHWIHWYIGGLNLETNETMVIAITVLLCYCCFLCRVCPISSL